MTRCTVVVTEDKACVTCDEQPYVAAIPARTVTDNRAGWNAGAQSVKILAGDCYVQFAAPDAIGIVCGLAVSRPDDNPANVKHGFYIRQENGVKLAGAWEGAPIAGTNYVRSPDTDVFRIERRGDKIHYFISGKHIHTSTAVTRSSVFVVACLYSATDGIY